MLSTEIYKGNHRWLVLGRDENKPEKIIDTNQYVILSGGKACILDPGGIELFPAMFAEVLKHVAAEDVTHLFSSHQDPDIISSLGLWDQVLPNAKLYSSWLWEGFIRHFGMNTIQYVPIDDKGMTMKLGTTELFCLPAHYLHSSGNFNVYDAEAKILFSGDIGASLEPGRPPMFVEDFNQHTQHMRYFHQRWMPSETAKLDWIKRVRELEIDIMAPQHGRLFRGDDVTRFLDWFEELQVGIGV